MKLLLIYLSRHRGLIFLALTLAVIHQVSSLLNPYILGNALIDPYASKAAYFRTHGLKAEFLAGITHGLLLIIAASTVSWITRIFEEYVVNAIIQKVGAHLYADVQRHALQLPYHDFEDQRSGEIVSILQRARMDCEKFINKFVRVAFATFIGISVVVFIAWRISPILPVVYVGAAILLAVIIHMVSRKVKSLQQGILNETTALDGSTTESLRNIELVKSLGLIRNEISRLTAVTYSILDREMQKLKRIRAVNAVYNFFINTLHQGIIFFLLLFVFYDKVTVGQLLMMQLYFYFIFGSMEELGSVIVAYREAGASLDNLQLLLSKPVERQPASPQHIRAISHLRFNHVHFQHRSAIHPVLNDVSFEVHKGETIAIVGPSGSGKSTLVKLLAGLYHPGEGTIFYDAHSHLDIDIDGLRQQMGLVTQDTQLFSGSIKENLLFVNPKASDSSILDVLRKAACQSLLDRSPKGIDTLIGEGGLKLSGGERQRLSIARSLLRDSRILIFDEATSSLDSLTEWEIADTIRQIVSQGHYITLMIAHRLSTIMYADRIYVLERGSIIETGTHTSLLEKNGLYYAMWRQQTGEWKDRVVPQS